MYFHLCPMLEYPCIQRHSSGWVWNLAMSYHIAVVVTLLWWVAGMDQRCPALLSMRPDFSDINLYSKNFAHDGSFFSRVKNNNLLFYSSFLPWGMIKRPMLPLLLLLSSMFKHPTSSSPAASAWVFLISSCLPLCPQWRFSKVILASVYNQSIFSIVKNNIIWS